MLVVYRLRSNAPSMLKPLVTPMVGAVEGVGGGWVKGSG